MRSENLQPEFPYDFDFVLKYWIPITPIETWHLQPDKTIWPNCYYYRCTQYDRFKKLCKAHKFKPPVCENYPWYGKAPNYLGYSGCAFKADLKQEGST